MKGELTVSIINEETGERKHGQWQGKANHTNGDASGGSEARNGKAHANDRHEYVFENLPPDLKDLLQWGVWRREYQNGKKKNVPYDAKTGRNLSDTNPETWSPYDVALNTYCRGLRGQWDGMSFVLKSLGGIIGLDIDNCVDEHGDLTPEAQEIANLWGSYLEYSPNRHGIRGFARGTLPAGRRKVGNLEIYDGAKALTVTGWCVPGMPKILEERTEAIQELHKKYFTTPKKPHDKGPFNPEDYEPLTDEEVIDIALRAKNGARVQALIDGDFSGYASSSEADLAACNYLAFYCGPNSHEQIDKIFRERFAGFRPDKWDKRHYGNGDTYGQHTIKIALEDRTEFYTRSRSKYEPPPSGFRLTETGNAERLAYQYDSILRWCELWKKWLVYNGTHWQIDVSHRARQLAKETVRKMYEESAAADDDERRQKLVKYALQSESEKARRAMLELAKGEGKIPALSHQFDADPWLLNVANGTIDLRTGTLRPHSTADYITKYIPIAYDPDASCPQWEAFLASLMAGNDDVVDFLWKSIGYSLTGDTREDCLFLLYGTGANGKSTFLTILRALLVDYGKQAAFSTFLHQDRETVRNDLADLQGARLVVASETDEGKRFSLSVVKQLTGQDKVKARFLFAENFEYAPQLKIWLATNHKPVIKGTDDAIWRRIRLIPFTQKFEGVSKDDNMRDKLLAELPGILAWAVRGCLAWQKEKLPMPETVKNATAGYKAESDIIGGFLEECCLLNPQAQVKSSALYNAYITFSGDKLMTQTAFSLNLLERGYTKEKMSVFYWKGIGLLNDSI
jgi:putative DNA primase/helicase